MFASPRYLQYVVIWNLWLLFTGESLFYIFAGWCVPQKIQMKLMTRWPGMQTEILDVDEFLSISTYTSGGQQRQHRHYTVSTVTVSLRIYSNHATRYLFCLKLWKRNTSVYGMAFVTSYLDNQISVISSHRSLFPIPRQIQQKAEKHQRTDIKNMLLFYYNFTVLYIKTSINEQ